MTRIEHIGGKRVAILREPDVILIYAIKASPSSPPVYIGSTLQRIKIRMRTHIADALKNSPLPIHAWMRDQQEIVVDILEVTTAENRDARERFWVTQFDNLLNVTEGGAGLYGYKFAGTEHARRIGAKLRTGSHFNCLVCGTQFWRKLKDIKKGDCKYCSRPCYAESQRKSFKLKVAV